MLSYTFSKQVRRFIWGYLFLSAIVIVLYQILWLVGWRLRPSIAILLIALSYAAFMIYRIKFSAKKTKLQRPPKFKIWPGLAAALIVCMYINLPLIIHPSTATVIMYAAKTGDDINHLGLIQADSKASGYVYAVTPENKQILDSKMIGYPQGWHINGSVFESIFTKVIGLNSIKGHFFSFWIYKTWWLFVATYLIYELFMTVVSSLFNYKGRYLSVIGSVVAGGLSLSLLVTLFGYGFQNFIASVALVCVAFILASQYLKTDDFAIKQKLIFKLSLFTFAATSIWILPGAILGLLTIVIVLKEKLDARPLKLWLWFSLAAAALLTLSQIYMTQKVDVHGTSASINSGGAAPPISSIWVFLLIIISVVAAYKTKNKYRKWIWLFLGLACYEFIGLAAYQQIAFGEQRYYAIKLAYLAALIALVIGLGCLLVACQKWLISYQRLGLIVFAILVLPLCLGLSPKKSAYPLRNSTPIKQTTAEYILNLPSKNMNAVIITPDKEESYLATKLWSSVNAYNSPDRQYLLDNMSRAIGQ